MCKCSYQCYIWYLWSKQIGNPLQFICRICIAYTEGWINEVRMVPLKGNIVFTLFHTLTYLHSIMKINWVTYGSLWQFKYFIVLCLKVTTFMHRACECLNSQKLLQVFRSTQSATWSIENEWEQRCLTFSLHTLAWDCMLKFQSSSIQLS